MSTEEPPKAYTYFGSSELPPAMSVTSDGSDVNSNMYPNVSTTAGQQATVQNDFQQTLQQQVIQQPIQQTNNPQQQTYPIQQQTYPMQQQTYPMQQQTYPIQQQTYPMQQQTYPMQQQTYPMQQVTYTMQQTNNSQQMSPITYTTQPQMQYGQQPLQTVVVTQPFSMGFVGAQQMYGQTTPHPIKSKYVIMQPGIRYTCCGQRPYVGYVSFGGFPCCFFANDNGCCTSTMIGCKILAFIILFIMACSYATLGADYSVSTDCVYSRYNITSCYYENCAGSNCIEEYGDEYFYFFEPTNCNNLELLKKGSCGATGAALEYSASEIGILSLKCHDNKACTMATWHPQSYFYDTFAWCLVFSIFFLISIIIHCRFCCFVYRPYFYKQYCCYRE